MTQLKLDKRSANTIIAEGRVLGLNSDRGRKILTLFVRNANTRGRDTYLTFTYEEKMLEGISVEDYVKIKAHSLSYKYGENNDNYAQYLICDEIEKKEIELQSVFDVDGGFNYYNNYVRAYFAGEVENVNKNNGWIVLEVKIPSKNDNSEYEYNTVRCQYSERMRVNDVPVKVGDTICIAAVMTSKRKISANDQMVTFENFVVDDMAIVDDTVTEEKVVENKEEKDLLDDDFFNDNF